MSNTIKITLLLASFFPWHTVYSALWLSFISSLREETDATVDFYTSVYFKFLYFITEYTSNSKNQFCNVIKHKLSTELFSLFFFCHYIKYKWRRLYKIIEKNMYCNSYLFNLMFLFIIIYLYIYDFNIYVYILVLPWKSYTC